MENVILSNVQRTYLLGKINVPALVDISVEFRPNRFTVISGPSGSGKTTLLNIVGCVDRPTSGDLTIAGTNVHHLSDDALSDFRSRHLGFIFQNFNLISVLSAYENVEYPLRLARVSAKERRARVLELLDAVGLSDRAANKPGELSGGQRQRVAIARALAPRPRLVLADEPTANLDSHTGAAIITLMREMQRQYSVSFIFSSHDPSVMAQADDAVIMRDGRIVDVMRGQSPKMEVAA